MRLFGIDYGTARLGVALGDTESRLASPWQILPVKNEAAVLEALEKMAKEEQVEGFVLGVPRPLGDQARTTDQAALIQGFGEKLRARGWQVFEENETLSTALAARHMEEREQKGKRDDLAATVILQTYLDRYGLSA